MFIPRTIEAVFTRNVPQTVTEDIIYYISQHWYRIAYQRSVIFGIWGDRTFYYIDIGLLRIWMPFASDTSIEFMMEYLFYRSVVEWLSLVQIEWLLFISNAHHFHSHGKPRSFLSEVVCIIIFIFIVIYVGLDSVCTTSNVLPIFSVTLIVWHKSSEALWLTFISRELQSLAWLVLAIHLVSLYKNIVHYDVPNIINIFARSRNRSINKVSRELIYGLAPYSYVFIINWTLQKSHKETVAPLSLTI